MVEKELIREVSELSNIRQKDVKLIYHIIKYMIRSAIRKGEKVKLMGFGTFEPVVKKERKGYNPRNGEEITIPQKNWIKYKPSQEFTESLN